ncbi:MAG: hypothetical protein IJ277_00300 [Bacteroidaceae bacterium]|nr:hypothetical protein [Bacteroidaceae bacterium]
MQLCRALKILHSKNIIHLDISPGNVMFTQAGNDLKTIDLGCRISNDNTRGHTKEF